MKRKTIESLLKSKGYKLIRSNKHLIYFNGNNTVAVPNHIVYTIGLSRRLLQQAGFNKQEIKEIL